MRTDWKKTIGKGFVAGALGFGTVAIVFAVSNLAAGRSPLFTAALLGATLLGQVSDPTLVSVTASSVLAYSALHLAVFLMFGIAAAALIAFADRGSQLWYVSLFFFVFFSFHLAGAVQAFALAVQPLLSEVAIWAAGVGASIAMAAYLIWRHPRVRAHQAW
jgi:hypothetical protein